MKSTVFSFPLFLILCLFSAISAFAQAASFSDTNADYTFDLPGAEWKMTAKPSALSPNVEYVYNDRRDGHLEVRKLTLKPGALLADLVHDEEEKLQFLKGFVAGKEESFAGKLRGTIFNYEYVSSGRNMSGRFYFLKADDTNVYVLRFTGMRDQLRSIRNQTDLIARTFEIKKSK
ncbi:MAG TPA: hypothetical protein VF556_17830 [Pyrinomonadaceae bacterium]|jgi:hypothetical protein